MNLMHKINQINKILALCFLSGFEVVFSAMARLAPPRCALFAYKTTPNPGKKQSAKIFRWKVIGFCFAFFTFLICPLAQAREFIVHDQATLSLEIAGSEPTRISMAGDRITFVRGTAGAYTSSHDLAQGAVFIQPTRKSVSNRDTFADQNFASSEKPFYLFISTEQGRNYVLLLTPNADRHAEILVLKPREIVQKMASSWEQSEAYDRTLIRLVSLIHQSETPPGYQVIVLKRPLLFSFGRFVALKQVRHYSGHHLSGDVYEITNRSNHFISLRERAFYQKGDRAIFLEKTLLAPHQMTLLIKVSSHG